MILARDQNLVFFFRELQVVDSAFAVRYCLRLQLFEAIVELKKRISTISRNGS